MLAEEVVLLGLLLLRFQVFSQEFALKFVELLFVDLDDWLFVFRVDNFTGRHIRVSLLALALELLLLRRRGWDHRDSGGRLLQFED